MEQRLSKPNTAYLTLDSSSRLMLPKMLHVPMLPQDSWCISTQRWSHLLSSTAGVEHIWAAAQRGLLGGQRVADILNGLLPGRGQWSGGTSTHRAAADLWSRRCFYFTEAANICQLTANAQKRNYTCQLTRNRDVHFREASPLFKIKVIVSSLKSLQKLILDTHTFLFSSLVWIQGFIRLFVYPRRNDVFFFFFNLT